MQATRSTPSATVLSSACLPIGFRTIPQSEQRRRITALFIISQSCQVSLVEQMTTKFGIFYKSAIHEIIKNCFFSAYSLAMKESDSKKMSVLANQSGCFLLDQFNEALNTRLSSVGTPMNSNGVSELVSQLFQSWEKSCYSVFQCADKGGFTFTAEDYELQRFPILVKRSNEINCAHYVLYMLNEVWATNVLFDGQGWFPKEFREPLAFFQQNGYQQIGSPQSGDLVVYFSKHDFQTLHYGVYMGDDRVLSKFGSLQVFLHPLESVFSEYGDSVCFFHKEIRADFQACFIELVTHAEGILRDEQKIEGFVPYDNRGTANDFALFLKELPFTNIFPGSIFNRDYNEELKRVMEADLNTYITSGSDYQTTDCDVLTTESVLTSIKQIAISASAKVKPRLPYIDS